MSQSAIYLLQKRIQSLGPSKVKFSLHTTLGISESGRVDVEFCAFLTLLLDGSQWSDSHPCHFISGEKAPVTHTTGGWVGPRTSLDASEMTKITFPCQIK